MKTYIYLIPFLRSTVSTQDRGKEGSVGGSFLTKLFLNYSNRIHTNSHVNLSLVNIYNGTLIENNMDNLDDNMSMSDFINWLYEHRELIFDAVFYIMDENGIEDMEEEFPDDMVSPIDVDKEYKSNILNTGIHSQPLKPVIVRIGKANQRIAEGNDYFIMFTN